MMPEVDPFAEITDVVQQFVALAGDRGDGPVHGLSRRVRRLRDAPKPPRTELEIEEAAIEIEYRY